MNLMKELQKLPHDSLEIAISRMTWDELVGLIRPIATKERGEYTERLYSMCTEELKNRNPAGWMRVEKEITAPWFAWLRKGT
jgi:hypothetical protein